MDWLGPPYDSKLDESHRDDTHILLEVISHILAHFVNLVNAVKKTFKPLLISVFRINFLTNSTPLTAQRLALVAGGRDESRRRNGKNSKPRKCQNNAPRAHLPTALLSWCSCRTYCWELSTRRFEDHRTTNKDIRTKLIETYIVNVWVSEELPAASLFDISIDGDVHIYFGYPVWTTAERLIIE